MISRLTYVLESAEFGSSFSAYKSPNMRNMIFCIGVNSVATAAISGSMNTYNNENLIIKLKNFCLLKP